MIKQSKLCINKSNKHFVTDSRPFSCDLCPRTYAIIRNIRQHVTTHIKKKKDFQCDLCEYKAVYSNNLKIHKQRIHATGSHKCSGCEFIGKTKLCISIHRETHAENNFECSKCKAKCGSLILLKQHYKNVHGKRRFKCSFLNCDYVGKTNGSLIQHQLGHTNTKPIQCDFCGRCFGRKFNCAEHILRYHINSDRFNCHVCDKRLCNKDSLRYHLQTHEENVPKPFECQRCSMKFRSKYELKKHQQNIYSGNTNIDFINSCDNVFLFQM